MAAKSTYNAEVLVIGGGLAGMVTALELLDAGKRVVMLDAASKHRQAEQPLKAWFREATASDWASPEDVKRRYRHASILRSNRVVFNIGGNKYRLVVQINYDFKIICIRFVGSHEAYDKVDAETI